MRGFRCAKASVSPENTVAAWGFRMDSFMDKLAQRMNAQEIIKANHAAEAEETDRLKNQVSLYENCLQEIRKVNLKSAENADKAGALLNESIQKMDELMKSGADQGQKEQFAALSGELEEVKKLFASQQELLTQQQKSNTDQISQMEDFIHSENLKVYRNVQAVVIDELDKQKKDLDASILETVQSSSSNAILPVAVITMILVLADFAVNILRIFGIL